MRMGQMVGRVSLSRCHPSVVGLRWILVTPVTLEQLVGTLPHGGEELVAVDPLGVAAEDIVGFSEGGEAAQPFFPEKKPIDAYTACILDEWQLDSKEIEQWLGSAN